MNVADGISDRDVFDRTGVDSIVNIDPTYSPVEVRTVSTGSGLSTEQATRLEELWRMRGLDPASPVTITPSNETSGAIDIEIGGDGVTSSTLTRQ